MALEMTASTAATNTTPSLIKDESSLSSTNTITTTTVFSSAPSSQQQFLNTPASSQEVDQLSPYSNASNAPRRPFTPHIKTKMTTQNISPPMSAAASASTPSSTSSPNQVLVHGAKRTASGTVKMTTPPLSQDMHAHPYQHSRNISVDSVASNISDLSSQLKTRLSYALVKVQNGWEQRSLEEVEALANPAVQRSRDLSNALKHGTGNDRSNHNHNCNWTKLPTACNNSSNGVPSPPKLAPAADLIPSAFLSPSSYGAAGATTATASIRRRPAALMTNSITPLSSCTPTMTPTPQEQDAVDSLLFMSSPANHTYNFNSTGPSTQTSSPARLSFFPSRTSVRHPQQHAKRLSIATEQDVERLLDSIHARRKDDEEVELIGVSSPRAHHRNRDSSSSSSSSAAAAAAAENSRTTPREVHV